MAFSRRRARRRPAGIRVRRPGLMSVPFGHLPQRHLMPTGPRGPLGPCPAQLAPWRAVQAPTQRPIRLLAGSAGLVGGRRTHQLCPPHDPHTHPRRLWALPTPPGVPWGHWGGVGHAGAPQGARKELNPRILRRLISELPSRHPRHRRWCASTGIGPVP